VETRVQRALQNRWIAGAAAIVIGYVAVRVTLSVIDDTYYDYYVYPRLKGAEYVYPELRYAVGQVAILIWSIAGLLTAALAGRCALFQTGTKWAARFFIGFALGWVLLAVGFVAGVAMRDLGL
jgi:uncharacterized membrane protein